VISFFGTAAEMIRSEGKWALYFGYTGFFIHIGSVFFVYEWLVTESRTVKMIGYIVCDLESSTCWLCRAFYGICSSQGI